LEQHSTYRTLLLPSEGLYKEKGSRFIGIAQACYSEEEAKALLAEWRNTHHQARHLCYAWRFGVDKAHWRANDDGEPSNSAGPPILGQIEAFDLSNVLIGVVRYYGGTKLGVGGLINAYRSAAKDALENGEIVLKEVFYHWELEFDYADMPQLMNVLKRNNLPLIKKDFGEACRLWTEVSLSDRERMQGELEGFESLQLHDNGIY
jgi:uncharacterized YigZ family protein